MSFNTTVFRSTGLAGLSVFALILLSACKGSVSKTDLGIYTPATNQVSSAPGATTNSADQVSEPSLAGLLDQTVQVNAGSDQVSDPNLLIQLNGKASTSSDASITKVRWTQTEGPKATLLNPSELSTGLMLHDATQPTYLRFQLSALDSKGRVNADSMQVTVLPLESFARVVGMTVNEAVGTAQVSIRLNHPASSAISINYSTRDDTAKAGRDYVAKTGTVIIPVNQSEITVPIQIINDSVVEPVKDFSLVITKVTNGGTAVSKGSIAIIDNDGSSQTTTLKWRVKTGAKVISSPAIGVSGEIYVGSYDDYLYALDPASGAEKWHYNAGIPIDTSPAVGADNTIYLSTANADLFAIDPTNGQQQWNFVASVWADSPAIGADGTIYVGSGDHNLYAVNPYTHLQKWHFLTHSQVDVPPAIASDGTVYLASWDGNLYALNPSTGSEKWHYATGGKLDDSPSIGADGTVYIGSADTNLYAIDPATGLEKWHFQAQGTIDISTIIGLDGTLYVGSEDHHVYALDPSNGHEKWSFDAGGSVGTPLLGDKGTLYVGSSDGKMYAVDTATGTMKWSYATGGAIDSSPAMGSDGTLYFGSEDTYIYALNTNSGGLAASSWPMRGQNPQHTGVQPVSP